MWDKRISPDLSDAYDYCASFVIPTATTDYDLKANQATLWNNLPMARGIVIKCDQTIGIKINSTSMPRMNCTAAQAPFEFLNKKLIRNAFITNNSGSDVNIEVLLV